MKWIRKCFRSILSSLLKAFYVTDIAGKWILEFPVIIPVDKVIFNSEQKSDLELWRGHPDYQNNQEMIRQEGGWEFNVPAHTCDEWTYIYLEPEHYDLVDFCWLFEVMRITDFRECAFNFRYRDFDNRYRYRFEKGRLYFDKKIRGYWFNNMASIPFELAVGLWHRIRIKAHRSIFQCSVNDVILMENVDVDLPCGSLAVILWEDDGHTNIQCRIKAVKVTVPEKNKK
jgi:hypothetical protein